jgi:hypothetical protein
VKLKHVKAHLKHVKKAEKDKLIHVIHLIIYMYKLEEKDVNERQEQLVK